MPQDNDPGWLTPLSRNLILWRQGSSCFYCEGLIRIEHTRMDHLYPKSKGGSHGHENRVASCVKCDARKGNRLPHPNELDRQARILIAEAKIQALAGVLAERMRYGGISIKRKEPRL